MLPGQYPAWGRGILDPHGSGGLALAVTISPPRQDPADEAGIEALVAATWAAAPPSPLGPWLLRAGGGFTPRANAVAALGSPVTSELGAMIEQAEAFYAARRLPARFELTDRQPNPALAKALAERGYVTEGSGTEATLVSPLRMLRSVAPPQRDGRVVIAASPSPAWIDRWWSTLDDRDESQRDAAAELIWDLRGRCGFAAHLVDGEMVATGLAHIDGSWMGLYCLGVAPERRHRGSARRIVGALATWGTANAARAAYVCVADDGGVARQLFDRLGFTVSYRSTFLRSGS